MSFKEFSIHVWNGDVGFKVDDLMFYINSTFYVDGHENDSSVSNSIGINLNEKQIDGVISLLNFLKDNITKHKNE
jgi:hypothetical protein